MDSELSLIKGGGGALLREKMIAYAAKRFIVIADSKKIVKTLGAFPLPVEVIRFGWEMTAKHIRSAGCVPQLRLLDDHTPFITDNGNYILDCHFSEIENPAELEKQLIRIPGVVESGLFVGMTEEVITVQNQDVHIIKNRSFGVGPRLLFFNWKERSNFSLIDICIETRSVHLDERKYQLFFADKQIRIMKK